MKNVHGLAKGHQIIYYLSSIIYTIQHPKSLILTLDRLFWCKEIHFYQ